MNKMKKPNRAFTPLKKVIYFIGGKVKKEDDDLNPFSSAKASLTGFTLVELMIAVAIVILLVALSINGLMRSRITANEAAAIKTLKTLHSAFASFRAVNSAYPNDLLDLGREVPPYIDGALARTATRRGYIFRMADVVTENTFKISATPLDAFSGKRTFYIEELGEIYDQDGVGLGAVGIPGE